MELKNVLEFPENELWDLTALYQDQEDFLRAIEKHVRKLMNLSVTTRVSSTPLKTLKLPLRSLNKFRSNSATLATTALCPKRLTLAMKLLQNCPSGDGFRNLGERRTFLL